jgi:G3E family GTPase
MSFSSEQDSQSSFLTLPNGCLCCSILEPGITAIENMVAQRPEGEKEVDWVVVELTGVADPGNQPFWEIVAISNTDGMFLARLFQPRLPDHSGQTRRWAESCG